MPVVLVLVIAVVVLRGCVGRAGREGVRALPPPSPPSGPAASSRHVALGIPTDADPTDDLLVDEKEFVVSYNPKRNGPNWVAWQLHARHLGHVVRKNDYHSDTGLPAHVHRVTPDDYSHSGYDRGHLCPSADRQRTTGMNSVTFLMTNMQPQLHELNAGPWERLEAHGRRLARHPGAELYLVAGGIFAAHPPTIPGKSGHGIAVPRAVFKIVVVLAEGQTPSDVTAATEVIAVSMPNERGVGSHAWTDYLTTVDEIERETSYDFLARVPVAVQEIVEARVAEVR